MSGARRDLVERSSVFSARLLAFSVNERKRGVVPYSLLQQALRAGTAIGAHSAEAQSAITRRHLIEQSALCANATDVSWLYGEVTEFVAILSASVKRLRDLP
ncbi:hypothetical protein LuPra_00458 [Luteitalea pratensis]|uniref:Four helix bundle protein n=1 Tax=Luteitalea pratensis TaxID=1855912 RepID=A0A143PFJ8_LUTPR|nr:hypothetical protein [Luteitalea pratensis]AMY07291.1 hypothetical protein LuPra_00458 [Luteitalea pratensis]